MVDETVSAISDLGIAVYSSYLRSLTEDRLEYEVQFLRGLKGLIKLYNSQQKFDSTNKDGSNFGKAAPIYS